MACDRAIHWRVESLAISNDVFAVTAHECEQQQRKKSPDDDVNVTSNDGAVRRQSIIPFRQFVTDFVIKIDASAGNE
jgi:hypothetical protein